MAGNTVVGTAEINMTVSNDPLLRLATQLAALGTDFDIFKDIDDLPPPDQGNLNALGLPKDFRPEKKPAATWDWADCHRSIHWGLAKFGIPPTDELNAALLPLASGTYTCLPAAAAVLETVAAGARCVRPLLAVMRESR